MVRVLRASSSTRYPIVSIEDGARRGRLGRLARADRAARRPRPARRRRPLRHEPRAARSAASTRASRNAILVKVNQIGTLTETLDAIALAREAGYACGHLAPLGRDRGHDDRRPRGRHRTRARSRPARPSRTDRVAKYNQLLRIEEELGDRGGVSRLGRVSRVRASASSYAEHGGRSASPHEDRRHDRARAADAASARARSSRPAWTRARLNFSHGTHDEHARAGARSCARSQAEVGRPIALIADLQGPKLRDRRPRRAGRRCARGEEVVGRGATRLRRTASCRSRRP